MPPFARIVVVDEPYHVTRRGYRRSDVFFSDEDREVTLAMLARDPAPPRKRGRPRNVVSEQDATGDIFEQAT